MAGLFASAFLTGMPGMGRMLLQLAKIMTVRINEIHRTQTGFRHGHASLFMANLQRETTPGISAGGRLSWPTVANPKLQMKSNTHQLVTRGALFTSPNPTHFFRPPPPPEASPNRPTCGRFTALDTFLCRKFFTLQHSLLCNTVRALNTHNNMDNIMPCFLDSFFKTYQKKHH